jgi:hypothetical protein
VDATLLTSRYISKTLADAAAPTYLTMKFANTAQWVISGNPPGRHEHKSAPSILDGTLSDAEDAS